MSIATNANFDWKCLNTWKQSAKNTLWCLIGCSIGDFGTILYFQVNNMDLSTLIIMILAIINGILTSIALETIILFNQMGFVKAFKTAIGMSIISMLSMEIAMNVLDVIVMGGAYINIYIIPFMLFAGFISAWPYNYWRLKKYKLSCH